MERSWAFTFFVIVAALHSCGYSSVYTRLRHWYNYWYYTVFLCGLFRGDVSLIPKHHHKQGQIQVVMILVSDECGKSVFGHKARSSFLRTAMLAHIRIGGDARSMSGYEDRFASLPWFGELPFVSGFTS